MRKFLKRMLAFALVLCSLLSYTVPAANAITDHTGIAGADSGKTTITYDFDQTSYYDNIPKDSSDNEGLLHFLLSGYLDGTETKIPMTDRFAEQKWTYEAACERLCGSTGENDHLPNSNVRMIKLGKDSSKQINGLRISMGKNQNDWIAFRIKSPGSGKWTMKLDFRNWHDQSNPTIAFYILDPAEIYTSAPANTGGASIDRNTVLARQECIQTAMDPNNRIGKVDQNAIALGAFGTAYIGSYEFEANKDYILVAETYDTATVAGWHATFAKAIFTQNGTEGKELTGEPEVNGILVEKNLVPASDGGYMGAVLEVDGKDYFFLPREGSRMDIYDLDKFITEKDANAEEAGKPYMTVNTGLYYPTHATVTDDGKVIVGGDGRRLYIFDTNTWTGKTTPDFRTAPGLENEGHNSSSFYNTDDKLIYFGTSYGGHIACYDMAKKEYKDLGDMVCQQIQEMALGKTLDAEDADDRGSVKGIVCHNGYVYGLANSDSYHILVQYNLASGAVENALDLTDKLTGGSNAWGLSLLGNEYVVAGASGASGLALVKLADFSLMDKSAVLALFDSNKQTEAEALWDEGMTGHATEVIGGTQYFFKNNKGLYSYKDGKMAYVGKGQGAFKTGAKTLVTLDRDGDGVEEPYLFSYAGGGQPRLFAPDKGAKISENGLQANLSEAGGSAINIGASYNDVLYIGAWNNWNCVAYDTGEEAIKSRYVTGGQTDSQVSYVDDDGTFHLVSGNYSACVVYEIDPDNKTTWDEDGDSNIKMALISNMKKYGQKRIHTVAGGDGYVFAGTIPTSYVTGGGVGVYNRATGKEDFIRFKETSVNGEKVVPNSELWDLAVQCIEYYDGRLFGTTTRSGGTGASKVSTTSAQIFVMDYKNMKIEATLDLRDYLQLPGKDTNGDGTLQKDEMYPISYIGGIQVDDQGRFWGLCSDVLFCFTYDQVNKTFTVKEILNLGHSGYETSSGAAWKSHKVVFDPANYQLFVSFYTKGLQQVVLGEANWKASVEGIDVTSVTNKALLDFDPATFALGANNNLYYVRGASLYMLPVNVKASDWTNPQAVDQRIAALGDITADKAADVEDIKATFNSLTTREKALVQETRTLKEAEAQVLELQIEAAIKTVSAGSMDKISDLLLQYNELQANQQRYVQNITALEEAYDTAIGLVEKATDVQVKINTLPDTVTLTDKAAVEAAREAYDALTEDQKALVDDTKLVDAEARIYALEGTQAVQEQIDALTDITLEDEAKILAARTAYDALSEDAKAEVDVTKLEAAEAKLATLKAAKSVQEQIDALPETVTLEDENAIVAARAAYNSTTTAARKLIITTRLEAAEAQLKALKNAVATEYVYDFKLYQNADYMTWLKNMAVTTFGVSEDYVIADGHMLYKIEYTNAQGTKKYIAPYEWFESAYTDSVDWAFEGSDSNASSNFGKDIRVTANYGLKVIFSKFTNEKKDFAAFRIKIPTSGVYQMNLSLIHGNEDAGLANNDVLDVYLIPAYETYNPSTNNYGQIKGYLADETYYAGNLTYTKPANTTDASVYTIGSERQLNAGEYVVVIRENTTNTCRYVFLDSLTMKKVVATVGDQEFGSLDDAFAYQVENGAESVLLNSDLKVAELNVPAGAVLDLNGKTLTAAELDAAGDVIDSSNDNSGMLKAEKLTLEENNSQLPVYDDAEGGYRFFEVKVTSVAITGKNSANPKYWFKINIDNFEKLHQLIKAGSYLDIAAKLTGTDWNAEATAGPEFLRKWADKYAATEGDFYITVSAVNAEGLESFSLMPCITANGVAICGDKMEKSI